MASVYVLYSQSIDGYYVGSCLDFPDRFQQHLDKKHGNAHTIRASDWKLFFLIENLEYAQARKIEKHIKLMKSRKYIVDLKKYPVMVTLLIEKYAAGSSR